MRTRAPLTWAAVLAAVMILATTAPQGQGPPPGTLPAGEHHRWMDELFTRRPAALTLSLARFIFPGSHDAGTYTLSLNAACEGCEGSSRFADPVATCEEYLPAAFEGICSSVGDFMALFGQAWGQAQHRTLGQQLNAGSRYFDLRFFRATSDDETRTNGQLQEGKFYIHHSLAGPESSIVLDDIATFLAQPENSREIIILQFEHMEEGDSSMGDASLAVFFQEVRNRIGSKMAKAQDPTCTDPDCSPTQRFGDATTLGEFLAQGSQVIVTCDCFDADDIWPKITLTSTFSLETLYPNAGINLYPTPDNDDFPWRTDDEVQFMFDTLTAERDQYPQNKMFALGVAIGLDTDGKALIRSVACGSLDPANVSGYCPAINDDWDQLEGLTAVAAYLNPKAIGSLVSLRRDRLNIVYVDHYTEAITEEIFKLNLGSTQVHYLLERVTEETNDPLDSLDFDSDPDYYPVFFYPDVAPRAWDPRAQRNMYIEDEVRIDPNWPGWKSYPNSWGTALVGFAIMDADTPAAAPDDPSVINFLFPPFPFGMNLHRVFEQVPITGCVQDAANCLKFSDQQTASGALQGVAFPESSTVLFRRSACVWSWLPGEFVDPASLCGELAPQLSIHDFTRTEGDSGSTAFDFVVSLSAPTLATVTVQFSTADGSAAGATDYTSVNGAVVTFAPGQTRANAKVFVNGDTGIEADETFTVTLSQPSGATISAASATGTIENDDVRTLQIGNVSKNEGNSGTTPFELTVTLSEASGDPVTVHYETTGGSATAGGDYAAVSDSILTFAPGETSKSITVNVNGDYTVEGDETFLVTLSQPQNAGIAFNLGVGTGTIVNDDVPASLTAPGPQSGNEGANIAFNLGTLTDVRPAGPWAISVNWGDGTTTPYSVTAPGALAGSHSYADNGSYTVSVSAADKDGVASNTITFTATIANVNPTATLANDGPIDEGGSATIAFSSPSDPSSADTTAGFRYAFSCTNGSLAAATYAGSSATPSTSCAFDDNAAPSTVRARIIDKDGGFTEYMTTVVVTNVAPTATLSDNGPVNEGSAAIISFASPSDPSTADTSAGFHYAFSCTSASLAGATYAGSSSTSSTSCTFPDDGAHTVRARIIDKDGGATEYTTIVTVNDVAPSISGPPGQTGDEGSSVSFDLGTLADPGADGPWTITVSWGDAAVESFTVNAVGALTRNHVYADNGAYPVTVSAMDKDDVASNIVGFTATIANVDPSVTATGSVIDENGIATVSGGITDPGVLDSFSVTVSWGDGTSSLVALAAGSTTYSLTHQYLDDNPTGTPVDVAPVLVAVVDKDGGEGGSETGVTVNNLAPAIGSLALTDETGTTIGASFPVLSGLPADLDAAFTDVGTLDTHQASIDWGDGSSGAGAVTQGSGSGTVGGTHTWGTVGTITTRVTVTDDDTGTASRETTFAVVDAAGAVCLLGRLVAPLLSDPAVGPATVFALTQLLGQLQGNIDAQAFNGACDMFAKSNYVAAVVKLDQAVRTIEEVLAAGGLAPAHATLLRQIERRLILAAKWTHLTLARATAHPQKLADAAALARLAEAATASGEYVAAIGYWLAAVRVLAPTS